ncbi:low temperature requirement protein A [Companilactobacillus kimchiensis]|uniref:Low temperature requirement protein ltra n=1 Tax=Companilactobacillus kimchiensis TaxID=993692 RepID=A0A0R2LB05_9LACO|nr:low temperature requirement protein A [Companilactobacillus kimchiensis]KRN99119.1 low temperature requirement protein ltra [Companilactobacillus kimchiensis]
MKVIPKKVQLTELFYDLVFVYAISQVTGLIHHLPKGATFFQQFIIFTIVMVVFINTWMVETVFTNRYGKNSIGNIMFFMVDMGILLFMSNNFVGNVQNWFQPFTIATAFLSGTLVLQYLWVHLTTHNKKDKRISKLFVSILLLRTVFLLIGALLPFRFGVVVALIGILSSWILPGVFTENMKGHPINFPHLLERLTALVIITIGETIVDIAHYFDLKDFNVYSMFIFVIVCALFMTYITQFDHFIDENRANETGNRLIYLHYPILFGISLITVSLNFIEEESMSKTFAVNILYAGILLFYAGLCLADYYNKAGISKILIVRICFVVSTIVGYLISLTTQSFEIIVLATVLVTVINSFVLSWSMVKQTN